MCYTLLRLLGVCVILLADSIMRELYMFSHIWRTRLKLELLSNSYDCIARVDNSCYFSDSFLIGRSHQANHSTSPVKRYLRWVFDIQIFFYIYIVGNTYYRIYIQVQLHETNLNSLTYRSGMRKTTDVLMVTFNDDKWLQMFFICNHKLLNV